MKFLFIGKTPQKVLKSLNAKGLQAVRYFENVDSFIAWCEYDKSNLDSVEFEHVIVMSIILTVPPLEVVEGESAEQLQSREEANRRLTLEREVDSIVRLHNFADGLGIINKLSTVTVNSEVEKALLESEYGNKLFRVIYEERPVLDTFSGLLAEIEASKTKDVVSIFENINNQESSIEVAKEVEVKVVESDVDAGVATVEAQQQITGSVSSFETEETTVDVPLVIEESIAEPEVYVDKESVVEVVTGSPTILEEVEPDNAFNYAIPTSELTNILDGMNDEVSMEPAPDAVELVDKVNEVTHENVETAEVVPVGSVEEVGSAVVESVEAKVVESVETSVDSVVVEAVVDSVVAEPVATNLVSVEVSETGVGTQAEALVLQATEARQSIVEAIPVEAKVESEIAVGIEAPLVAEVDSVDTQVEIAEVDSVETQVEMEEVVNFNNEQVSSVETFSSEASLDAFDIFVPYQEPVVEESPEIIEARRLMEEQLEVEMAVEGARLAALSRYTPTVGSYNNSDSKIITVVSLYPGVGSTFIAMNAATVIGYGGETASVVEYLGNSPELYSYLDGDSNRPDNWKSISARIEEESSVNGRDYWKDGNVFWFPLEANYRVTEVTTEKISNYMLATGVAKHTFIDVSSNWKDEVLDEIYNKSDEIWVVFQPHVAKVFEPLMQFKEHADRWVSKVKFICNKSDSHTRTADVMDAINFLISNPREYINNPKSSLGAAKKEFDLWSEEKVAAVFPAFPPASVSKAEWDGRVYAQSADGRKQVADGFSQVLNVAEVVVEKEEVSPRRMPFSKLFRRKEAVSVE